MELAGTYLDRVAAIKWFSKAGAPCQAAGGGHGEFVVERREALRRFLSTEFIAELGEAQGRLTSHLSRTDYRLYASTWNSLARRAAPQLENEILPAIEEGAKHLCAGAELTASDVLPPDRRRRSILGVETANLLDRGDWPRAVAWQVTTQLGRGWLEASYRQRFLKAPIFFEYMVQVYQAGRLPCGAKLSADIDGPPVITIH